MDCNCIFSLRKHSSHVLHSCLIPSLFFRWKSSLLSLALSHFTSFLLPLLPKLIPLLYLFWPSYICVFFYSNVSLPRICMSLLVIYLVSFDILCLDCPKPWAICTYIIYMWFFLTSLVQPFAKGDLCFHENVTDSLLRFFLSIDLFLCLSCVICST